MSSRSKPWSKAPSLTRASSRPSFRPATQAVTLLKDVPGEYRVLVTDINLPGIDDWELNQRAREIDPNFPVVYISGASPGEWPSEGVPNIVILEKSFAPA